MTPLLIGCPVAHRGWIIRQWADHAAAAAGEAGFEPWFLLAAHPDDPTPGVLAEHLGASFGLTVVPTGVARTEDRRRWQPERYTELAVARNDLLGEVRRLRPGLFLSLDSDVLLAPAAVKVMAGMLDDYDAAGSAVFLSHPPRRRTDGKIGTASWIRPNYAMLSRAERLERRWQADTTRRADVLMAVKLMSPAAYHVDYEGHEQGEDIGWAIGCRNAGLKLGWTSTVISKHVMTSACGLRGGSPIRGGVAHEVHDPWCPACVEPIDRPDPRCGF